MEKFRKLLLYFLENFPLIFMAVAIFAVLIGFIIKVAQEILKMLG